MDLAGRLCSGRYTEIKGTGNIYLVLFKSLFLFIYLFLPEQALHFR